MAIEESKIIGIENKSEYFKDILDKIPSWIMRWGNTLIFTIFLVICLGLNFIKYPEVITADVIITTNNPPIEVYSRTNGRISTFFKHDQDNVIKGEWIIELNNLANHKEIKKIIKVTEAINDTNFIENIETTTFPLLSNLGEVQDNYSKLLRSVEEYLLFIKLNPQIKRLNLNKGRVKNIIQVKYRIIKQKELLLEQSGIVKTDLNRYKSLLDKGVIPKVEYEKKEIEYLKIKARTEAIEEEILRKDLEINDVFKESTDLEFNQNNTYFKLRGEILETYNSLLFDLKEWKNKYIIKAPITGNLNLFDIRTEEEFVSNEQKVFTVNTQNEGGSFALVKLPIKNSGKLNKNQLCVIKLHNYPYQEFGMLRGTVSSFTTVPKEGFYTVKVILPEQLVTTTNKTLKNTNNLTGRAEIIIGDYTIFQRLFHFLTSNNY